MGKLHRLRAPAQRERRGSDAADRFPADLPHDARQPRRRGHCDRRDERRWGRAAMMKQKSLDGMLLNLSPVTLLTGPDRQTQAEQLITSITPAASGNAVPADLQRLSVVSDANVTGAQWWLFANSDAAPTFHAGFLEGFEAPRLSIVDAFKEGCGDSGGRALGQSGRAQGNFRRA